MTLMSRFRRALRSSVGRPVAYQIGDGYGASIVPVLEQIIRGDRIRNREVMRALDDDDGDIRTVDERAAKLAAPLIIPAGKNGKATAMLSVRGIALYDLEFQPYCFSTLRLSQVIKGLANDPEIGTIVLDIDSPGGHVTGVKEAADAIFEARKTSTIVALVNPLAASAAYHLASQASEIVAVPSADVGSVGVFMLHAECSGLMEAEGIKHTFIFAADSPFKVEGNAYQPLSPEAQDYWQGEVDLIMSEMVKAIARGRGVTASKVIADFGQGRTLMAGAARAAGMIDRVATINQALSRWGVSAAVLQDSRRAVGLDVSEITAVDDEAVEREPDAEDAESSAATVEDQPSAETADPETPEASSDHPEPTTESEEHEAVSGSSADSRRRRLAHLTLD